MGCKSSLRRGGTIEESKRGLGVNISRRRDMFTTPYNADFDGDEISSLSSLSSLSSFSKLLPVSDFASIIIDVGVSNDITPSMMMGEEGPHGE